MRRIIGFPLIAFGVCLLAGAALTRLYVAPKVIEAPTDAYQVTRLRAENAAYFDAATARPRTGATIVATNTVRGDVGASRGDVAVWDSTTVVQDADRPYLIDVQKRRYAFDRRTGELGNCCGAALQGDTSVRFSGIGLFWPVDVRTKGLKLFDSATRRSWPVAFDGKERVDGVLTHRFVVRIPETKIPGRPLTLPGALLGRPENTPVPVRRYYQAEATYWIDPRTGAPVDQRQRVLSTLRPDQGPGRLVATDMTLRMTPESHQALLTKSGDGARKIRNLKTIGPLAGAALGLLFLVAGLLLARRPRRNRPPSGATEGRTLSPGPRTPRPHRAPDR